MKTAIKKCKEIHELKDLKPVFIHFLDLDFYQRHLDTNLIVAIVTEKKVIDLMSEQE